VYEWIKALHIIAVIAWMAGMLYLPRLFVYHCEAEVGSKQSETFKVMERRLLKAIINPAMIVTWLAGLYLAWSGHWFSAPWLHGKLLLVVLLSGVHGFFFSLREGFCRRPQSQKSEILSFYQRGTDIIDGRNRHFGGSEAILTMVIPDKSR
jgi:protoporphyrinogen IX oxidase